MMGERVYRTRRLTDAEVARDKKVRDQFASRPTMAQLKASGDFVGPMSIEEYFAWLEARQQQEER
jgi:hypothetical protein